MAILAPDGAIHRAFLRRRAVRAVAAGGVTMTPP